MNKEIAMALVRFIVPLIASVATIFGWTLDWELVLNILLSALSVIAFAWTWWKNNNVTESAQEAQAILDALKDGTLEDIVVNKLADGDVLIDLNLTEKVKAAKHSKDE